MYYTTDNKYNQLNVTRLLGVMMMRPKDIIAKLSHLDALLTVYLLDSSHERDTRRIIPNYDAVCHAGFPLLF